MAAQSFPEETAYPLGAGCPLFGGSIQLRNPHQSELIPSFVGCIPEAARTLDLPLLDALRPHLLPPALLLPTHTFLLPVKAPSGGVSPVSSLSAPHALDCSFMPSHPHCLVCTCAGGGGSDTLFSLDLHTCRVIHAFALAPETLTTCQPLCIHADPVPVSASHANVTCRMCSPYSRTPLPALPGRQATSRVSCVTMHRDPSSPLLFLGTSAGDVLAYDLRFPGGSFQSSPCLSLRGAHDGVVSGVRAASGPLLPSHSFFTSGLIDGWIKLFDFRFPFNHSTCKGMEATTRVISRGAVPYPVEAVQPDPSFGLGKRASSSEGRHPTGCVGDYGDTPRDLSGIPSAASPKHQRICFCCSNMTKGRGGVAGIDLSPDGTLLAVAHVQRPPPGLTDAEEGCSTQVNTPPILPRSKVRGVDVKTTSRFTGATEKGGTCRAAGTLSESENSRADWRTVVGHRGHHQRARKLSSSERPRAVCRGSRMQRDTVGRAPLKGETIIYSVSERLRALKTFAVADGCAFTGVEFSANGKYLLQTGGTVIGPGCLTCRSCTCCCNCYACAPGYKLHDDGVFMDEPSTPFSSTQQIEPHRARAWRTTTIPWRVQENRSPVKQRLKARASIDEERSERMSLNREREDADRPSCCRDTATESSHRAQIVNLIQCNRVALLKSPADGALAFTDTSVMKHSFASEESERLRCSGKHAKGATVPDYGIPASSLTPGSPYAESVNVDDSNDCFTLRLHVAEGTSQASSPTHSVFPGSKWSSTEMIHEILPLHLRLYSPSSRLMDRRRQAFAQTEAGWRNSWLRSGHFESTTACRCAGELGVKLQKSSRKRQRERIPSFSSSSSELREFISSARGSAGVFRYMRKLGYLDDPGLLHRKQLQLPFPRYNSQTSLFLTACGVLHPRWGRHDYYGQQFLCTFWGGLVAGLGGSRLYPGLKLWHAATGIVLTCAEGPLATDQAVRCVRAHPDLSLGILATGGSLRLHPDASATSISSRCQKWNSSTRPARNSSIHASGGASRTNGGPLHRPMVTCAAVTLWTLEQRDRVLERAFEGITDPHFNKGTLLLDPSDED